MNPEVHDRFHKSPLPILSQLNPVHGSHFISWRCILILSSHLRLGLPSGLFPSVIPTKTLSAPLFSLMSRSPCHSWFDRPNIWCGVGLQIMKPLIMQSPSAACHLVPPSHKYLPQHTILKHTQHTHPRQTKSTHLFIVRGGGLTSSWVTNRLFDVFNIPILLFLRPKKSRRRSWNEWASTWFSPSSALSSEMPLILQCNLVIG